MQELRHQAQRASATRCLHRTRGLSVFSAQQQRRHGIAEAIHARGAGVGLAHLVFDQPVLGLLDCGHDRRATLGILVDTNTQIHLLTTRILRIACGQAQDRIVRKDFQMFEKRHRSSSFIGVRRSRRTRPFAQLYKCHV